jgi:acetylornithine/succinyldiaminopimelate/putrescine aminotransferase
LQLSEKELIDYIQSDFVNFYEADAVNPYVALAAAGPWLITTHGAVLHDSGGYGMIGFGQTPKKILEAMSRHHVMANIMTPNFSQKRLTERLNKEIGHNQLPRPDRASSPGVRFVGEKLSEAGHVP